MNESNETRTTVVRGIETVLSEIFPGRLKGERADLVKDLVSWAKRFAENNDMQIETQRRYEPVVRTKIILKGTPSFVVAVHDPMEKPSMIPAESITGADYAVEFPVNPGTDKFLLVQLKTKHYPLSPKQYFGMGATYMFMHYLAGINWTWFSRYRAGAEYTTKRYRPHNEFLFLKIVEENLYIPISSVLRTFKGRSKLQTNLTLKPPKSGNVHYSETATLVDFSEMRQHMTEYYVGLSEFMNSANDCNIGMKHMATSVSAGSKADSLYFLSWVSSRPNVLIIETKQDKLSYLSKVL